MGKVAHIGAVGCAVLTLVGAAGGQIEEARQAQEAGQPARTRGGRVQFAVRVESVTLDVVVVDKRGRFIPGLAESDFVILDGGEPQDIQFFNTEFTPVTTMLLLDSSSSIRSNLGAIQTAGYLFAQNLSEGDTARVGLFGSGVRFGPGFTDDLVEHYAILSSMRAAGKTALYDAIITALKEVGVVEDIEAVKDAFADVQEDLHRHYRMAYIPREKLEPESGVETDVANWRPLEVRVKNRDDLIVRTRQGYYSSGDISP